jgi:hypothetical protein
VKSEIKNRQKTKLYLDKPCNPMTNANRFTNAAQKKTKKKCEKNVLLSA